MSGKYLDITNQRFGRLTALKMVGRRGTQSLWDCLCDCGNHKTVSVSLLRSGRTKSCGCLKQESDRSPKGNEIDLVGQTFGMLTVLKSAGSDKRGEKLWECQCACGNPNHSIVLGSNLRKRTHCSCGCARMSTGEIIIANLLIDNHIPF